MNTLNEESHFGVEELFFSRTDKRGIIQNGNDVFVRVSGYTKEQLMEKPHNIIRHPDMPKAVFYLLWDKLKKNEPIGAYVKNRSKDGKYYWVYALAIPIQEGYLSVRLKPTSSVLTKIAEVYS